MLLSPHPFPPIRKLTIGPQGRGVQEKLLHPRLPIRQAVGQEVQVGAKARLRRNRMMSRRIEGVVHGRADAGAKSLVARHHRRSPAVGEHRVEPRQSRPGGVIRASLGELLQRRRSVHVPEDRDRLRRGSLQYPLEQQIVEDAHAARLDHHVGRPALLQGGAGGGLGGVIDDRRGVGDGVQITVLLPVEGVGFVEGDLPAPPVQRGEHAPIVGRRPIPVRADQRGAVEGEFHGVVSTRRGLGAAGARLATTLSSSSTRWPQV